MTTSSKVWKHEETALILIDYQKEQFDTIHSETSGDLIDLNVRSIIKAAKAFDMPIVLSTVGVEMGINHPTRPSILVELPDTPVIDRTTMNAWEDANFVDAVKKTGRKRLIFGALYTEICLTYPVIDALAAGYEVMFVVDAVGGFSQLAHRTAIERLEHLGAIPNTTFALITELFRDFKAPEAERGIKLIKSYLVDVAKFAST